MHTDFFNGLHKGFALYPMYFTICEQPTFLNEALDPSDPYNSEHVILHGFSITIIILFRYFTVERHIYPMMAGISLTVVHAKKQIFPPSLSSQRPFLYYFSKLSLCPHPHWETQCHSSLVTLNMPNGELPQDIFNFQNIRSFNLKNQVISEETDNN